MQAPVNHPELRMFQVLYHELHHDTYHCPIPLHISTWDYQSQAWVANQLPTESKSDVSSLHQQMSKKCEWDSPNVEWGPSSLLSPSLLPYSNTLDWIRETELLV
jgi:hypothetical protein